MSFRLRTFFALCAAGLIPLALLLVGARREVGTRATAQFRERSAALASVVQADLSLQGRVLGERLGAIGSELASDNRFRLAFRGAVPDRRYILDYAEPAMRRAGLDFLEIAGRDGRIVTSGHFRNEYGRNDSVLIATLRTIPDGTALIHAGRPAGDMIVLARLDSARVAGEPFALVGGVAVDRARLSRLVLDPLLDVSLRLPGDDGTAGNADSIIESVMPFPFVDALNPAKVDSARIVVAQPLAPLHRLRRSLDLWFLVAAGATAGVALLTAGWLASRVTRPLQDLARKTARIDLDRLDMEFDSAREDEIGALARLLEGMTQRLRASMATLREAERRATVGDLARQLNHDVKNGLIPIRNVFRHLAQVARESPQDLPAILLERRPTVDAAIGYLETLARNYARLSPAMDRQPCDLNAAIEETVRDLADRPGSIRLELERPLPLIAADPIVIRRILENLVRNGIESLDGRSGTVTIATANRDSGGDTVQLTVADSGRGMSQRELEKAFEDFYTTKAGGTGLGLSIVKRLVLDLHGSLRVETQPGEGTRFIIDFPAVP